MDFRISNIYINNEELPAMPAKRNDVSVDVECTNDVLGTWNVETWSLDLKDFSKATECKLYLKSDSQEVVDDVKNESTKTAAEEAAKEIIDGGSSNNTPVDNPATGAFINIFLILAIIGAAAFIIVRAKKKNKFYRI